MTIPESEFQVMADAIQQHPEYLDTSWVTGQYRSLGLDLICDPFSPDIPELIINALQNHTGYSVIRMGDGELNVLSYQKYKNTPILDRLAYKKILDMQQDSFAPTPELMTLIQDMMLGAVVKADIIGVIGLWRPRQPSAKDLLTMLENDARGTSGHWRAIDYMLQLAQRGYFTGKTLASAHLYFSVLENLGLLISSAQRILVISNRADVTKNLQKKYPSADVTFLSVGNTQLAETSSPSYPGFLSVIYNSMPERMNGCLCLIGAGPWSEIYCGWVKERGGVAVDVGSGFDLLDGKVTRPVHSRINTELRQKYAL